MLLRRLNRELSELKRDPPANCSAGPEDDNMLSWVGIIVGPENSPYEDGHFRLSINFGNDYPFKPPKISFTNKIYHPNINHNTGAICLDVLSAEWSPAQTITKLLLSVSSLLTDPNPYDPLASDVAKVYLKDKEKFNKVAKEWTDKFAKPQ